MILAELTKLRRSALWIVAVVLPLLAVVTGTVNYDGNQAMLSSGWTSYWSQVVLFYGMLFMSMGIAVLAATAWRMEHQGHNWNLLMAAPARASAVAGAKLVPLALVVAVMQLTLFLVTVLTGKLVLGLDGWPPLNTGAATLVGMVAALPVIALQSLLSMLVRSFAVPVALGLLGCVVGTGALLSGSGGATSYLVPQSLVTLSSTLGSTAVSGSGALDLPTVGPIVLAAAALTLVLWFLASAALNRGEAR